MKFPTAYLTELESDDEVEGLKVVDRSKWVVSGDYQEMDIVFSYEDKLYMITLSRSGSPFTDYHYDSDYWPGEMDCPEVEKVEVVVTTYQWKVKE